MSFCDFQNCYSCTNSEKNICSTETYDDFIFNRLVEISDAGLLNCGADGKYKYTDTKYFQILESTI